MNIPPGSFPWVPDQGDGTFKNPVLHADYSDPDVIRHGEDFYMVSSSFNCTPGLPILHSRDLVNWKLVNHAIKNIPHPSYRGVRPGCGAWAPSLRFHDAKFWIFFPMPDEGIYVTCADDPAGKWSNPWCLQEAKGWIDPCPFWDDDGSAYLVHAFANSRAGKKERIHVRPMTPDCRRLLGEGKEVIHTPHHPFLEGPKVHKWNGWYYILAPGGGVPQGWQVAFRSSDIYGPYEEKIVLERGSTAINGPHQGALIDLPDDEWWFMHFQDTGPFGRIVHMQPVEWQDGWPLMGVDYDGNGVGEPVPSWRKPNVMRTEPVEIPQTSDEFDAPSLGLQWQWNANHEDAWASLEARPGWLRLLAQADSGGALSNQPHLVMQKFPSRGFAVETAMDFQPAANGSSAGLTVVGGGADASLALLADAGGRWVVLQIEGCQKFSAPISTDVVRLRVAVDAGGICTFGYALAGERFVELDDRFTAREGGWIGARVGLYATAPSAEPIGCADFDYFRFSAG